MRVKVVVLALGICLFLLIGCAYGRYNSAINHSSNEDTNVNIVLHSMWINLNEEELFGYADIVALGEVKSISNPQETKLEDVSIIYKDYSFVVKEAYKGMVEPGTEIIIRVPGGTIGKKTMVTDAARPEKDKQQILFLKKSELANSKDEAYDILCGPLGKYVINDNKIENQIGMVEDVSTFKERINGLKNKIGNNIILPPCFIR